jgi:hypothetical protein
MSTLVANLPPIQLYVDKGFLLGDNISEPIEFVPCTLVSVKSVPGCSFLFEIYIPQMGALYDKVPVSRLWWKEVPPAFQTKELMQRELQPWDCFAHGVVVVEKNLIQGCEVEARLWNSDGEMISMKGNYVLTLDSYATENPDLTFSHHLPEHKSHNLIALENGQYALLPNNLVTFKVSSLYWKEPEVLPLKVCQFDQFRSEDRCIPLGKATRVDYSDS